MINEKITAQLSQNNRLPIPIPIPSFSYNKIDAEVYINGVQEEAGWSAHITPISQILLVPSGENAVFMPVNYTPHDVGVVEFVFKIYSQGSLIATVRKTVDVEPENIIIDIKHKEGFKENDTDIFKVFNNSTMEGRIANVGWKIEQRIENQWEIVLEPEPFVSGVVFSFPAGESFNRSISLKGLKNGEYRFSETVSFNERKITVTSLFMIN